MMNLTWLTEVDERAVLGPIELWSHQNSNYGLYYRYWSGIRLKERAQAEPGETDPPELFPVKVNLVKLLAISQADALWGEWDDRAVTFSVSPDGEASDKEDKWASMVQKHLHAIQDENALDEVCWEIGLSQNIYGGSVLKASPDANRKTGVRIERIPVSAFYPVWNPDDPNDLLEAWVVTNMSPRAAERYYGFKPKADSENIVRRIEHWTKDTYETHIGGKRIDAFSGENPWGRVPLEYGPRLRSSGWYGDALTEDLMGPQDELNYRLADMGDSITYNANPVRWGYNLPKEIHNRSKFPLAPNALWDLGRTLAGMQPPELRMLEARNPVPPEALEYINFVYDWGRTIAGSPPVAFGEDEGSQRSGATLVIRMWPLTRAVKRSRMYNKSMLKRLMDLCMLIGETNFSERFDRSLFDAYRDMSVDINFAPILPRDRTDLVDEVVKRFSTEPKVHSQEDALRDLGVKDVEGMLARIREDEERTAQQAIRMQPKPQPQNEDADKGLRDDEDDV